MLSTSSLRARRRLALVLALTFSPLLPGVLGCRDMAAKASDRKEGVLAQVDDVVITVSEFQDRINAQSPYVRARYASLDHKKEFLDNLVKFELLAAEAKRQGLDQDPEVVRTVKQVMIQRLLRQKFDTMKADDISDADVKAYFDAHPEEFNRPPEVRVSLILVPDEATAKKVLADPRAQGLENVGFRDLVAQYSTDSETKERGGDLRFFDEKNRELPPELVQAAFKLSNMGEVSPPVKTARGYALLKLTGRRSPLVRTLAEVSQSIRAKLFRERRQRLLDEFERSLRQKARVQIHEQRLATVKVDLSAEVGAPDNLRPLSGTGDFHPSGQQAPQASPDRPQAPAQPTAPAPGK